MRCLVSEPSAGLPSSQTAVCENGCGALPRGGAWSSSCARPPGTRDNTIAELDPPRRPTSSTGPTPPTGSARRAVVVLQVISLVFQGVEGLVLDLPAGPSPRMMSQTVSGISRSVIPLKCRTVPSGWISQYSSTLTNSSGWDSLSGTPLQNENDAPRPSLDPPR